MPNITEKITLTMMHDANINLFFDDNPIAIEYIDVVMAHVSSVMALLNRYSINKGNNGNDICNKIHMRKSSHSSGIEGMRLAIPVLISIF